MRKLLFAVGTVVAALAILNATHAQHPTEPGLTPYSPTRIEWLALDLNAGYRTESSDTGGYSSISYLPNSPNTIVILAQYTDGASAASVDNSVEVAKLIVKREATHYGWSDWVKVETQRKLLPTSH